MQNQRNKQPSISKDETGWSALISQLHEPFATCITKRRLQCTQLPSSVRVISEYVPSSGSFAMGIWIGAGSRHDLVPGTAHLLEHVLFCRSRQRTGGQRWRLVDGIGAQLDATTSKELTGFYARGAVEHFGRLADILGELVFAPTFTADDVLAEQRVTSQEICGYLEEPEELIEEHLDRLLFGKHPLGNPITGTGSTIRTITHEHLLNFHRRYYVAPNTTVIVAGPLPHEQVVEQVSRVFERWYRNESSTKLPDQEPAPLCRIRLPRIYRAPVQQVHTLCTYRFRSNVVSKRHLLAVMNAIVGDSASSRLQRTLRERQAVAYTIYSTLLELSDAAAISVYAATSKELHSYLLRQLKSHIQRLGSNPPTHAELKRAKAQLKADLLFSAESMLERIHTIAHSVLIRGRMESLQDSLAAIERCCLEEVQELAQEMSKFDNWACVMLHPMV